MGSRNLSGTTLYSTCEPCPMCFTACWWANIDRIVFGISLEDSSKLFVEEVLVSCEYLNKKGGDKIKIEGGILREEILKLF